jgi:hypothetical protein
MMGESSWIGPTKSTKTRDAPGVVKSKSSQLGNYCDRILSPLKCMSVSSFLDSFKKRSRKMKCENVELKLVRERLLIFILQLKIWVCVSCLLSWFQVGSPSCSVVFASALFSDNRNIIVSYLITNCSHRLGLKLTKPPNSLMARQ